MFPSDDDILLDSDSLSDDSSRGSGSSSYEDDNQQTLVTKEGLKKLKDELEHLKVTRRKEVSNRLKEAISYGDLSENSEYEEAKNEQAFVEGRIIELERKIKSAKIITEQEGKKMGKEANIGSHVTVRNLSSSDGEEQTYTIVGATEADPFDFKISNESPIGKALLTRVKGDTISVVTPSGNVDFEVLKVA